ncbi:transcriptional regulator [Methanotrichaceae archaeon M04Ac]|uniref:Transcriptional regulator n=1 Tax=Candidatus Methanocrinis alkalitolerans TaxID=3033395 RepID=A0ABT5XBZ9_9EURY|nr:transcriptional regulator [Candidatus Methanocrinis alkalitolerans]MCR3884695.1 transcriptional regulator [Methanothrix sp.]MDF0592195.1 transcriptional regulator [Candidatus Methanocrinis alkalitolerans]
MMEEMIGFVMGNKQRIKILEVIESKGPQPAEKIAKFGRLTAPVVGRTLEEVAGKGLLKETDGVWKFTDLGVELSKELKKRG